jgi:hypothetical protein
MTSLIRILDWMKWKYLLAMVALVWVVFLLIVVNVIFYS